jgi:hypothetical protein
LLEAAIGGKRGGLRRFDGDGAGGICSIGESFLLSGGVTVVAWQGNNGAERKTEI